MFFSTHYTPDDVLNMPEGDLEEMLEFVDVITSESHPVSIEPQVTG